MRKPRVMEPVPGPFAGSPEHKPFTAVIIVVVSGGLNSSILVGATDCSTPTLTENIKHFDWRVANKRTVRMLAGWVVD